MKVKKWIIIIAVLLSVIGVILILSWTVFGLKSVEVDFRTSTTLLNEQDIIKSGDFKYNSPIFFQKKSKYEKNIEDAFAYADVINIETIFPSKLVIHIAQRNEVYALESENEYYICDENLRILGKEREFDSTSSNAILLSLEEDIENDLPVGEYISVSRMPQIYQALYELNRPIGEQTALIQSITQSFTFDEVLEKRLPTMELKLFSGQTVRIVDDSYGLKAKLRMFLDVYGQLFDAIGKTVDGQELTEENLKTCTILIASYYDYTHYGEEDCYANIILND